MRSNTISYFFLAVAAVLATAAVILLFNQKTAQQTDLSEHKGMIEEKLSVVPEPIPNIDKPLPIPSSDEIIAELKTGLSTASPADLLDQLSKAMAMRDIEDVTSIIGKQALNKEQIDSLQKFLNALPKDEKFIIRELGELELNKRSRWAINFSERYTDIDIVFIDLLNTNGKWLVEKISIPQNGKTNHFNDSLNICDAFIQAILKQEFTDARKYVDSTCVTDAKIAGLCILFEEGEYRMRKTKPIRAMFKRDDYCGFLANVTSSNGSQNAQFAINLKTSNQNLDWKISEINLDGLLSDYAKRIAGGDVYYSPLVSNPAGGETIAIYFEFDENTINPRTKKQLEIVASLLKSDSSKKITISGHTDAKGTDSYNDRLSSDRAKAVKEFLTEAQVPDHQILTIAKGSSQPRRPNITENGEDDPQGRRANRRTEIYLDF